MSIVNVQFFQVEFLVARYGVAHFITGAVLVRIGFSQYVAFLKIEDFT